MNTNAKEIHRSILENAFEEEYKENAVLHFNNGYSKQSYVESCFKECTPDDIKGIRNRIELNKTIEYLLKFPGDK